MSTSGQTIIDTEFDAPAPPTARARLAEALGLSWSALERAEKASRNSGQPLAVALSLLGLAPEDRIAEACAEIYDAPLWRSGEPIERIERPGLSLTFLRDRYAIAMTDEQGGWCIGLVDPGDNVAIDALIFALAGEARFRTLTLSDWRRAQPDQAVAELAPDTQAYAAATWLDDSERLKDSARDAPVVRLAEQILERAFLLNASDVHVEQKIDHTRVRFRIDGVLQDQERLGPEIGPALIARVKVLSDLDVAERRAAQDGRSTLSIRGAPVDVRISTTPTVFGESLVVRLLTRRDISFDLGQLGLRPSLSNRLDDLLKRPHGLLLVTGPTGSGKTTTLYAALRRLASARTKILTIEDPVEYVFEDILQSQVNEATGFTFSTALRAFLRHDPDVILVGEIRDTETARLAIQASLTGHLVLATVHTNSAATTPARLIDMGVERYLLADALIGVMAQRLAPRLCADCRVETSPPRIDFEAIGALRPPIDAVHLHQAKGCLRCQGSGRRGRVALGELLVCDAEVRDAIAQGAGVRAIQTLADQQAGYASLRQDAVDRAIEGLIDWDDALRLSER